MCMSTSSGRRALRRGRGPPAPRHPLPLGPPSCHRKLLVLVLVPLLHDGHPPVLVLARLKPRARRRQACQKDALGHGQLGRIQLAHHGQVLWPQDAVVWHHGNGRLGGVRVVGGAGGRPAANKRLAPPLLPELEKGVDGRSGRPQHQEVAAKLRARHVGQLPLVLHRDARAPRKPGVVQLESYDGLPVLQDVCKGPGAHEAARVAREGLKLIKRERHDPAARRLPDALVLHLVDLLLVAIHDQHGLAPMAVGPRAKRGAKSHKFFVTAHAHAATQNTRYCMGG